MEKIWNRFKAKQAAAQQQARATGTAGAAGTSGASVSRPAPQRKSPSKPKPVTDDMLKSLKDKFGKQ